MGTFNVNNIRSTIKLINNNNIFIKEQRIFYTFFKIHRNNKYCLGMK